ncbi:transposase [Actinophytocola oryzae]|uniref:Putative transposase of IS4/5 family DUF4096 n=1 Tax=Actinophytocola oryzae TaxID=502181 RepID=A0A4V3FQE8_9PSEU|nr:transposase [Actinophytocola oryzae]TDV38596.1 putative transposase of IS4/5 family DUF4096 [Actinophytocola oryzae]
MTDAQWSLLEGLVSQPVRSGRSSSWNRRLLVDGIRWRVRTGSPWRDMPSVYGSWSAAYALFRRWQTQRRLQRLVIALQALADVGGRIMWGVSVDIAAINEWL